MMAEDVLAVLDHAGIRRASLVDTSLGGMIAQELALAHPERVDKLVLVATIPGGPRSRPMPLAPLNAAVQMRCSDRCWSEHSGQALRKQGRPHAVSACPPPR